MTKWPLPSPKRLPNIFLLSQLHIFKAWRMIWLFSNYGYKAKYYISHNPLPMSFKITFILKVHLNSRRETLTLTTEGFSLVKYLAGISTACFFFYTYILSRNAIAQLNMG